MRRRQQPPLPKRHGLDPARLRLPEEGEWATIRDHLVERLPRVPAARIDELLRAGGIVDLVGPIAPDAAYVPGSAVWFHRDLPDETTVPFDIPVVHRDDDLLVVDKPHFLATIPRGQHILQTALVRLRGNWTCPTWFRPTDSIGSQPVWSCSWSTRLGAGLIRRCSTSARCARSTRRSRGSIRS